MKCSVYDPEVIGSNPSLVELGVCSPFKARCNQKNITNDRRNVAAACEVKSLKYILVCYGIGTGMQLWFHPSKNFTYFSLVSIFFGLNCSTHLALSPLVPIHHITYSPLSDSTGEGCNPLSPSFNGGEQPGEVQENHWSWELMMHTVLVHWDMLVHKDFYFIAGISIWSFWAILMKAIWCLVLVHQDFYFIAGFSTWPSWATLMKANKSIWCIVLKFRFTLESHRW